VAVAFSTDVCAINTVEEFIVTVDVSEGVIWAVEVSSAWAILSGANIDQRPKSNVIKAILNSNVFICLPPN
jgi:hypothetical protein